MSGRSSARLSSRPTPLVVQTSLSSGDTGEVWRAASRPLQRSVEARGLFADATLTPVYLYCLRREARTASGFNDRAMYAHCPSSHEADLHSMMLEHRLGETLAR